MKGNSALELETPPTTRVPILKDDAVPENNRDDILIITFESLIFDLSVSAVISYNKTSPITYNMTKSARVKYFGSCMVQFYV